MPSFLPLLQAIILFAWPPLVGDLRYPDLRALPPEQLLLRVEDLGGERRHLLRFTASVWNAGPGPLEVRGVPSTGRTEVFQRIYGSPSVLTERLAGSFAFHPTHEHWHFENFAAYELWRRGDYERWLASGRTTGAPRWRGSKTTGGEGFCLRDSAPLLPATDRLPLPTYRVCDQAVQGISVGWQDTYPYFLPGQWVDLGPDPLPNGDYVLRIVADPLNLLHESPAGADPARESPAANETAVALRVEGSRVLPAPVPVGYSGGVSGP